MARDRPVLDLGRSLADHDLGGNLASRLDFVLGSPGGPTAAQAASQLTAELAAALDEEGFVDGLVTHPHHRIVRELLAQTLGDLVGRPPLAEPLFDLLLEPGT
jgi:hypothetical protein